MGTGGGDGDGDGDGGDKDSDGDRDNDGSGELALAAPADSRLPVSPCPWPLPSAGSAPRLRPPGPPGHPQPQREGPGGQRPRPPSRCQRGRGRQDSSRQWGVPGVPRLPPAASDAPVTRPGWWHRRVPTHPEWGHPRPPVPTDPGGFAVPEPGTPTRPQFPRPRFCPTAQPGHPESPWHCRGAEPAAVTAAVSPVSPVSPHGPRGNGGGRESSASPWWHNNHGRGNQEKGPPHPTERPAAGPGAPGGNGAPTGPPHVCGQVRGRGRPEGLGQMRRGCSVPRQLPGTPGTAPGVAARDPGDTAGRGTQRLPQPAQPSRDARSRHPRIISGEKSGCN
ncbi:basic salivary proline-rich protein 2-like [Poecile atricapillus]|uniref:basic salivary proline-rich protein 2-like n=1 Tax=Poecile atricapillus TaxID=48891 RepID=UPI0027397AAF|nr:basic salivary proline-rich protein 2-like [Poecile atricapillus]